MASCADSRMRDAYSVFLESIDSLVCGTLAYGKFCVVVTVVRNGHSDFLPLGTYVSIFFLSTYLIW